MYGQAADIASREKNRIHYIRVCAHCQPHTLELQQSAIVEFCENRICQSRNEGFGHKVLRRPAAGTMVHLNSLSLHGSFPRTNLGVSGVRCQEKNMEAET